MNNVCIDIDYSQIYKHGQKIGGDVFLLSRNDDKTRIVATLSDGLGSGVKANVLASMTAHMGHKFSFSPMRLSHSAEIIMDTLPVDKEMGISYATFTIAHIEYTPNKDRIQVGLVEYDNPDSLRFHDAEPVVWSKKSNKLHRKAAVKEEIVRYSSFPMESGDRLIFFSDGVAQSGVSLGPDNVGSMEVGTKGWGTANVRRFVARMLQENPDISSRDLSRAIVTQAYQYDNYKANDDITCAVISVHKPRRTLIITGAPRLKDYDPQLAELARNYDGNIIVCGGTTAKIVAREMGVPLTPDKASSGSLPPSSCIEGIDLVTEGMVTLTEIADRLEKHTLLKEMPEDAAKRFIKIMRQTDQVEFVVGTKINDAAEDNVTVANFGIRIPLVARLKRILEERYLLEVDVRYL
ncbi:MAG: SpoIIE family protein phosphatase [Clostridiales bacterium]|nr:SpoIIE family protein phosphatase [Candidatus Crickella caballi]